MSKTLFLSFTVATLDLPAAADDFKTFVIDGFDELDKGFTEEMG